MGRRQVRRFSPLPTDRVVPFCEVSGSKADCELSELGANSGHGLLREGPETEGVGRNRAGEPERGNPSGDPARGGVVGIFSVSLATLKRWLRKRREVEDLSPGSSTGRERRILATVEERWTLWACGAELEDNDETTLQGQCELWEEQRGVIGVRRHDKPGNTPRAGLDLQKRRWVTLGATGRDEQARGAWREHLRSVDPERFWCSWTGARRTSPSSHATPGRPVAEGLTGRRLWELGQDRHPHLLDHARGNRSESERRR